MTDEQRADFEAPVTRDVQPERRPKLTVARLSATVGLGEGTAVTVEFAPDLAFGNAENIAAVALAARHIRRIVSGG